MNSGERRYIWEAADWPNWRYDLAVLVGQLSEASRFQGMLLGRLADVGMALRDQASLANLTEDVVKTSEIEGEVLNVGVGALVHRPSPRRGSGGAHRWIDTSRASSTWCSTPHPAPHRR
jgi:hypothetical protein